MEIYVATDLWGSKTNLRMRLPDETRPPPLEEFKDLIERTFQSESMLTRPVDMPQDRVPTFRIAHLQLLIPPTDNSPEAWIDVTGEQELSDKVQLFVFQPPNPYHSDSRELIPQPRDVGAVSVVAEQLPPESPRRGAPITALDRAQIAFRLLDRGRTKAIPIEELTAVIAALGVDPYQLADPIDFSDPNRRYVTYREWMQFAELCPNVVALIANRLGGAPLTETDPAVPEVTARDLSPPRRQVSSTLRQQTALTRLSSGLSSIVTKKDRDIEQVELARMVAKESQTRALAAEAAAQGVAASPNNHWSSPQPHKSPRASLRANSPSASRPRRSTTPTLVQPRWSVSRKRSINH